MLLSNFQAIRGGHLRLLQDQRQRECFLMQLSTENLVRRQIIPNDRLAWCQSNQTVVNPTHNAPRHTAQLLSHYLLDV